MGHRASMNGELIFDNVRLPKENMLGREGGGFETLNAIYDTNGVGTGSMAVGVARAAYEAALQYAKEREIWGQPIGKYQAVGHMLADMRADIEMARLMVRRVAWQSAHRDSREGMLPPTMAKVYPAEMARRVTIKAMQIYGRSRSTCATPWSCPSSAAPTRSSNTSSRSGSSPEHSESPAGDKPSAFNAEARVCRPSPHSFTLHRP